MKLKETDRKVLNYLYCKYLKQHGSSVTHLDNFTIFVVDDGMKKAVPKLYDSDPELKELKDVFKELSLRGFVNVHGNYRNISLTKEGFNEASKTWWRKFIDFFNSNPGLAVLISLISLVVAVIALFKSSN
jgi:hypothetical protein